MPDREISPDLHRRLVETLGLDDNADSDDLNAAITKLIEKADRREVDAAIMAGKIQASSRTFWTKALKTDRAGTRQTLAAMSATRTQARLATPAPAAVPDRERERTTPTLFNSSGETMQERVELGRPPSEWTKSEHEDAALWALGPNFRNGLEPPPEYSSYIRDLTQPHLVGQAEDGTEIWERTDPYG